MLPIADRHAEYAATVAAALQAAGLRAELDERQEKINYKIREAQLQKVPYMLVVGDREAAEGAVAVRSRAKGDLGATAGRPDSSRTRLPRWQPRSGYPKLLCRRLEADVVAEVPIAFDRVVRSS